MNVDLHGVTVLVTRQAARSGRDQLKKMLTRCGANVILHPVIELKPSSDSDALLRVVTNREGFEVAVFFSPAGVWFFSEYVKRMGLSRQQLRFERVAAIGASTAKALYEIGWSVDLIPAVSSSASLAETLVRHASGSVLLLRADRGSDTCANALRHADRVVQEVAVYESRDVLQARPEVRRQLADGKIDWVTITSGSIARSAVRLFGENLRRTRLLSLSPQISAVLSSAGFHSSAEASAPNFGSMIEAMAKLNEC